MKDNPFKGVNRFCANCIKKCKQFENVTVAHCPNYEKSETQNKRKVLVGA